MNNHRTNLEGLSIIRRFEGFQDKPYRCPGGLKTIGFGHVIKSNESFDTITFEEADALLLEDVKVAEEAVKYLVKVPLNENQFSALVSFVYNLGYGNLRNSTLLKILNDKQYLNVPSELIKWRKASGAIFRGLLMRRLREALLFVN